MAGRGRGGVLRAFGRALQQLFALVRPAGHHPARHTAQRILRGVFTAIPVAAGVSFRLPPHRPVARFVPPPRLCLVPFASAGIAPVQLVAVW